MPFQVVPSIDLRNGQVVRLQQGDYARQINYPLDPVETAQSFQQAGATWIHLVDLDGAKAGRPTQLTLLKQIASSTNLNVQIGGGVRSTADIQTLLDLGAHRVVVGTQALNDWPWFTQLAHTPSFAHKLTLALDAKDGLVATHAWTQTTGRRATDIAAEVSSWPLATLLYTDVSKDGMLQGPNLPSTLALAQAGNVPVCASGGVGSLDHIRQLINLPLWGVIVGRSLHEGKLDLAEAIRLSKTSS